MTNFYIESTNNSEANSTIKEFDYFINADINNSDVAVINVFIKNKHVHYKELADNFRIMLNSVRSYYDNNRIFTEDFEESYVIEVEPEDCSITLTIYDADFDIDGAIQNFIYTVGYLQCSMIRGLTEQEDDCCA